MTNKVPQAYGLLPIQGREDNILLGAQEGAVTVADSGASVKVVHDKIADGLRLVTDYVKIFGQVQTFDEVVYQERADRKSKAGV